VNPRAMTHRADIPACPVTADLTGVEYCVALNFRKTARALTKTYDAVFQTYGLRSTQFSILVAVAKLQPASIGDLADVLFIDPSTLSRSLRLLQKQRFVVLSGRAAMRQRFVTLSRRGAEALENCMPQWRRLQKRVVARIGRQHWKKLQLDLERISLQAQRALDTMDQ